MKKLYHCKELLVHPETHVFREAQKPPLCPVCRHRMTPVEPAFPRLTAFLKKAFDLEGPGWSLMRRSPR